MQPDANPTEQDLDDLIEWFGDDHSEVSTEIAAGWNEGDKRGRMAPPDGMSLEEVGAELGVSRERVRQIEAKAMKKIAENPECWRLLGMSRDEIEAYRRRRAEERNKVRPPTQAALDKAALASISDFLEEPRTAKELAIFLRNRGDSDAIRIVRKGVKLQHFHFDKEEGRWKRWSARRHMGLVGCGSPIRQLVRRYEPSGRGAICRDEVVTKWA